MMKMFFLLISALFSLDVASHGISPVRIDAGIKPLGVKFPVKIRIYNTTEIPRKAEVFLRGTDKVEVKLGETSVIKPGGYNNGIDIKVYLVAKNSISDVCTRMRHSSSESAYNTVICSHVKVITPE
ncbi:hypothetical protein A3K86_19650 [Photobacterium jeanii]|uniref:Uncharacterized protein n=1 Tax=Photobacterium jeanii TaxID=858640 RepID=A0A178K1I2_9GAMM|nr:hypothetical protein [Photobacterium jeanii]OAN11178.1 hypothetical protein A3K86_19650 [Photobacterium jeanii]PST90697.1 hypothetical protein C9I91_08750 [Photobacterium jeanii]